MQEEISDQIRVNVVIPAYSNSIIIMRRHEREASYQVTYYGIIGFKDEEYIKALKTLISGQAQEKDQKRIKDIMGINPAQHIRINPIQYQDENVNMLFVTLLISDGYLWLLENRTSDQLFEVEFEFDLNNLSITSSEVD